MTLSTIKLTITAFLVVLIISCSQKYDGTGIFDPVDPNFRADTSAVILENDTVSFVKKSINDGYIYIGRDIAAGDTTAWAESVFKVDLPLMNDSLVSAYIIYNINSSDPSIAGKTVEIFKTSIDWTDSTVENIDFNSDLVSCCTTAITSLDSSTFQIRIDLNTDSLSSWAADDSVTTQPENFYMRSPSGSDISPIIKMYSSKWSYSSLRPKIYSNYSYLDTLTATDNSDSIVTVTELDSAYISGDMSLVHKKNICLDLTGDKIKLGGISGESYLCKLQIPDSIPTTATVLTGRLDLTAVTGEEDPVYGNISNNLTTGKEVSIYIMTDSLWYSDDKILNYDTLNVWTYKINLSDSSNYLVMDKVIQKWITEPESNFGFLITTKNWGSPFGYSVFLKPKLNVSYITLEE